MDELMQQKKREVMEQSSSEELHQRPDEVRVDRLYARPSVLAKDDNAYKDLIVTHAIGSNDEFESLDKLRSKVIRRYFERSIHTEETALEQVDRYDVAEAKENREINKERIKSTHSHRYAKTRKSKMKTSAEKMRLVSEKIGLLKQKKDSTEDYLSLEEKVSGFADIYSTIRESDRYFAESFAKSKLEENLIKAKADRRYYISMKELYIKQKEQLAFNVSQEESKLTGGTLTKTQIKGIKDSLKSITKKQEEYGAKIAEYAELATATLHKIDDLKEKLESAGSRQ